MNELNDIKNWRFNLKSIGSCTDCGKKFCDDEGENGERTLQHDLDDNASFNNIETDELICVDCAKSRGIAE